MYMYLPTALHEQDTIQSQYFKSSLADLNLEFSSSRSNAIPKLKNPV